MRSKARALLGAASLVGALPLAPLATPAQAAPPLLRGCSVTTTTDALGQEPTVEIGTWTADFVGDLTTFQWQVTCWLQFGPTADDGSEIPGTRMTCKGAGVGATCRQFFSFFKHPAGAPTFLCVHVTWVDPEGLHTETHDADPVAKGAQCTPLSTIVTPTGGRITTAVTKRAGKLRT